MTISTQSSSLPPVDRLHPRRLPTRAVRVGDVTIGGDAPLLVQSMTITPTQDVDATVAQCISLAESGCKLVRITAPGVVDAKALGSIRTAFTAAGFAHVPLCADIHFMPAAAMEAIEHVEKVRVNPGNFADKKRFQIQEYTDAEYDSELQRIHERFSPLVRRAKQLGRALRIGTNHGSLSDRIMNRYGDTPEGMVESALEFVRIAESEGFQDLVISMKSSHPRVMVQAYRQLVAALKDHGTCYYPLHLGVTEAGDGEDGRIKGASGIGTLLADGIGDTIRVSLTESPEAEIPVAQALADAFSAPGRPFGPPVAGAVPQLSVRETVDPLALAVPADGASDIVRLGGTLPIGGGQIPKVLQSTDTPRPARGETAADGTIGDGPELIPLVHSGDPVSLAAAPSGSVVLVDLGTDPQADLRHALAILPADTAIGIGATGALDTVRAYRLLHALIEYGFRAAEAGAPGSGVRPPICLALPDTSDLLAIAADGGAVLTDGIGDCLYLPRASDPRRIAFSLLQALKLRTTRTDYVACPSCGRTLFDLMEVTAHIKAATSHLDGVTIAIMGCIVNGPGEMADADFGYVGSGPGKITLYRGKEPVMRNIPAAEAREALIQLIKDHGMWKEPDGDD